MNRNEFAAKLKDARLQAGLTQAEVAYQIDRPQQTIGGWEVGRSQPDMNTLYRLLQLYQCSPNTFFGFGNSLNHTFTSEEFNHIKKYRVLDVHGRRVVDSALDLEYDRMTHVVEREQTGGMTYIRCYDLAASAGTGEPLGNTYYSTRIEIPTQRVPENAHCCIRVNGDSMEPAYKDGDIVFVQRQDELIREGEVGIFVLNGEGYIKRLGHRELESLNSEYPPIPIHDYDDLRCQGRVLGKV